MSIDIIFDRNHDGSRSFTFPALTFELTDQLAKELGLTRAFRRLAKRLCRDHPVVNGQKTIGVSLLRLDFNFELGKEVTDVAESA